MIHRLALGRLEEIFHETLIVRHIGEFPILEDIEVELSIVLGSAQVQIRQILQMSRGAMIPLDCGQDDPTLVFVNGELIAKGRILVNSEEMSLEVTEITRKSRN